MGLDTNTEVEQIRKVQNEQGDQVSPATEERQVQIAESLENEAGLDQFEFTTSGTDAEPLPANAVPEGVEVLVEYRQANGADVYLGDAETQLSPLVQVGDGRTYSVTDTAAIYVRTPNAGDGVIVTYEVSE